MSWVLVAVSVGTVISAGGAIMQGQQANAAAKAQSRIDQANARIADNNAILADQDTTRQLDRQAAELRRIKGSQRSAVAASGLTLSGSMLDVISDTELQAHLEQSDIYRSGSNRSNSFLQQGSDFRAQSAMSRAAGYNARTNSTLSAGGTLISGAGQVGYMKSKMD